MNAVSVEELGSFLRQRPPRTVPPAIRRRALKGATFGILLFGLIFTAMGVPFAYIFFPWRISDDLKLNAAAVSTNGVVTVRESTNMTENDRRVHRYHFTFSAQQDHEQSGVCYATRYSYDKGSRVTVHYLQSDPQICRIENCRLSPFGWGAGFVVIFPLIGVLVLAFGARFRRRRLDLLRSGQFSTGLIERVEGTNMTVNNEQRYKVTVSYDDTSGVDHRTSYGAYGHDVQIAQQKRQEGATIGLLYDPANPKRVILVDTLVT